MMKKGIEEKQDRVVLRGIFKLQKKSHDVLLTRTSLTWTPITPETPTAEACMMPSGTLLLQDVFAVKVKRRRAAGQQAGGAVLGVALFHCTREGRRLKEDTLHLHNASSEHVHTWFNTLKDLITGFEGRPRSLKVFINPRSHRKEAVPVYRDHVAPLFKIANINTDITVMEKQGHCLSVMKECPLDEFDGVVCVGGDGSVAELSHAVVLRAQLDANCPEDPVRSALPLGIIPAGSTDVVSCSVHGVRDPVTAAMHIVLGHLQRVDMCSFSSPGHLIRFGFSAFFGFGGQSLARAEKTRWTSSSRRREYAVVKTLACMRPEECQLSFLPVKKTMDQDPETDEQESWVTNHGLYLSISILSIPCLSPYTPRGLAPSTRLANGSAALTAVGNVSRSEFMKHLKGYGASAGQEHTFGTGTSNQPLVETHTVSAVRIRPQAVVGSSEEVREEERMSTTSISQSESCTLPWNIDGQLVQISTEVLVRVHPGLISLFGDDVDEWEEPAVSCSCI